jgi:hypothetical protein
MAVKPQKIDEVILGRLIALESAAPTSLYPKPRTDAEIMRELGLHKGQLRAYRREASVRKARDAQPDGGIKYVGGRPVPIAKPTGPWGGLGDVASAIGDVFRDPGPPIGPPYQPPRPVEFPVQREWVEGDVDEPTGKIIETFIGPEPPGAAAARIPAHQRYPGDLRIEKGVQDTKRFIAALDKQRLIIAAAHPNDPMEQARLEKDFTDTWMLMHIQDPENAGDRIEAFMEDGFDFGVADSMDKDIETEDQRTLGFFRESYNDMFLVGIQGEIDNAIAAGKPSIVADLQVTQALLISSEEELSKAFLAFTKRDLDVDSIQWRRRHIGPNPDYFNAAALTAPETGQPDPYHDRKMRDLVAFWGETTPALAGGIRPDILPGSGRAAIIAAVRLAGSNTSKAINMQNRQRETYHKDITRSLGLTNALITADLSLDQIHDLTTRMADLLSPPNVEQNNILISEGTDPALLARDNFWDVIYTVFGKGKFAHMLLEGDGAKSVARIKSAAKFSTEAMAALLNQVAIGVIPEDHDLGSMVSTALEGYVMGADARDVINQLVKPFQITFDLDTWERQSAPTFASLTSVQAAYFEANEITAESIVAESEDATEAQIKLDSYLKIPETARIEKERQDIEDRRVAGVASGRMAEVATLDHGKAPQRGSGRGGYDFDSFSPDALAAYTSFTEGGGEFNEALAQTLGKSHRLYGRLYGGESTRQNPRDAIGSAFISSVYNDPLVDKKSLTSFDTALTNKLIREAGDAGVELTHRDEATYHAMFTGQDPAKLYADWEETRMTPGTSYIPPRRPMGRPV